MEGAGIGLMSQVWLFLTNNNTVVVLYTPLDLASDDFFSFSQNEIRSLDCRPKYKVNVQVVTKTFASQVLMMIK